MRISDWSSDVCSSDLIADDARTDAANVETAHLRFAEEEAVGQADLVARRRRARAERIDIAALGRDVEDEAAAEVEVLRPLKARADIFRSEEHTSELQSLMRISYAVFCLKKKKKYTQTHKIRLQLTKSN